MVVTKDVRDRKEDVIETPGQLRALHAPHTLQQTPQQRDQFFADILVLYSVDLPSHGAWEGSTPTSLLLAAAEICTRVWGDGKMLVWRMHTHGMGGNYIFYELRRLLVVVVGGIACTLGGIDFINIRVCVLN